MGPPLLPFTLCFFPDFVSWMLSMLSQPFSFLRGVSDVTHQSNLEKQCCAFHIFELKSSIFHPVVRWQKGIVSGMLKVLVLKGSSLLAFCPGVLHAGPQGRQLPSCYLSVLSCHSHWTLSVTISSYSGCCYKCSHTLEQNRWTS